MPSISPCADDAKELVDIPVIKIDEAMARSAVAQGERIGVAATLRSTLDPTVALLEALQHGGWPVRTDRLLPEEAIAEIEQAQRLEGAPHWRLEETN